MDIEAFERTAANARRGREPGAYHAAVDLYAGELLPEDRYEAWAEERREASRLTYLSPLLEIARLQEERGESGPGIEALRLVVAEEPAHEEANADLMRLLGHSGGRGEAILQYEHLRRTLLREHDRHEGRARDGKRQDVRVMLPSGGVRSRVASRCWRRP